LLAVLDTAGIELDSSFLDLDTIAVEIGDSLDFVQSRVATDSFPGMMEDFYHNSFCLFFVFEFSI
jgi:hypothetical protein